MITPIVFLQNLRSTFGEYPPHSGGCFKVHMLLKNIYPHAVGYYNEDHVITEIEGVFYDIYGATFTKPEKYLPFSEVGYPKMIETFKEHL